MGTTLKNIDRHRFWKDTTTKETSGLRLKDYRVGVFLSFMFLLEDIVLLRPIALYIFLSMPGLQCAMSSLYLQLGHLSGLFVQMATLRKKTTLLPRQRTALLLLAIKVANSLNSVFLNCDAKPLQA